MKKAYISPRTLIIPLGKGYGELMELSGTLKGFKDDTQSLDDAMHQDEKGDEEGLTGDDD